MSLQYATFQTPHCITSLKDLHRQNWIIQQLNKGLDSNSPEVESMQSMNWSVYRWEVASPAKEIFTKKNRILKFNTPEWHFMTSFYQQEWNDFSFPPSTDPPSLQTKIENRLRRHTSGNLLSLFSIQNTLYYCLVAPFMSQSSSIKQGEQQLVWKFYIYNQERQQVMHPVRSLSFDQVEKVLQLQVFTNPNKKDGICILFRTMFQVKLIEFVQGNYFEAQYVLFDGKEKKEQICDIGVTTHYNGVLVQYYIATTKQFIVHSMLTNETTCILYPTLKRETDTLQQYRCKVTACGTSHPNIFYCTDAETSTCIVKINVQKKSAELFLEGFQFLYRLQWFEEVLVFGTDYTIQVLHPLTKHCLLQWKHGLKDVDFVDIIVIPLSANLYSIFTCNSSNQIMSAFFAKEGNFFIEKSTCEQVFMNQLDEIMYTSAYSTISTYFPSIQKGMRVIYHPNQNMIQIFKLNNYGYIVSQEFKLKQIQNPTQAQQLVPKIIDFTEDQLYVELRGPYLNRASKTLQILTRITELQNEKVIHNKKSDNHSVTEQCYKMLRHLKQASLLTLHRCLESTYSITKEELEQALQEDVRFQSFTSKRLSKVTWKLTDETFTLPSTFTTEYNVTTRLENESEEAAVNRLQENRRELTKFILQNTWNAFLKKMDTQSIWCTSSNIPLEKEKSSQVECNTGEQQEEVEADFQDQFFDLGAFL